MVALSGAASGIGAAVRARLLCDGARVIGVDLGDAEVCADLATPAGRRAAVDGVRALAPQGLTGAVACAGLGPHVPDRGLLVSVNYFGAAELLEGLRPLLVGRPGAAAVAVASNSASLPNAVDALVDHCLAGDENAARTAAATLHGASAYAASKRALACWVRRSATGPDWAGRSVRLNAVAPGAVQTPLLDGSLADPVLGPAVRGFPIPTGGFGTPDAVADAIAFLLGPDARFCCGSVLFVDGGSDALLRPDAF
ncbi:MAG: SDR family oxidoreductase [bacterium]|nr:SDR family oxidoreductase [bacterium]